MDNHWGVGYRNTWLAILGTNIPHTQNKYRRVAQENDLLSVFNQIWSI